MKCEDTVNMGRHIYTGQVILSDRLGFVLLYLIVEFISCAQLNHSENLVLFGEFTFHEMVQNTFSHRGPQRCASVVQSSVRLARVQGLQHVTNLLPRALQHVERRDAQRCSRSTKTLACVQLSPEFRSRFIMSSSCDASSTCPIPSRSSWPPLHDSYSQTPGGTLFSTTPGGEMRLPSVFIFNSRIYFLTSDFVLHASFSRILQRTLFLCEVS